MDPSSLVDVIVCGLLLDSKIFISCRLGFASDLLGPRVIPGCFLSYVIPLIFAKLLF